MIWLQQLHEPASKDRVLLLTQTILHLHKDSVHVLGHYTMQIHKNVLQRQAEISHSLCCRRTHAHKPIRTVCTRAHKGASETVEAANSIAASSHLQFVTARLQQSYLAANILPSAMFTACQFYSTHADSTVCNSKQAFRALVQLHDTK